LNKEVKVGEPEQLASSHFFLDAKLQKLGRLKKLSASAFLFDEIGCIQGGMARDCFPL
jgi:hypothetical protein